jgi:hypothetical protein
MARRRALQMIGGVVERAFATASLGSAFRLAIVLLIISFGGLQPFGDVINIPLRGSDTGRRLLLERVEDVHLSRT